MFGVLLSMPCHRTCRMTPSDLIINTDASRLNYNLISKFKSSLLTFIDIARITLSTFSHSHSINLFALSIRDCFIFNTQTNALDGSPKRVSVIISHEWSHLLISKGDSLERKILVKNFPPRIQCSDSRKGLDSGQK